MTSTVVPATKKRSIIWKYFTAINDNEAKCNTCNIPIKLPTGTTSSMIKHLSRHPTVQQEYNVEFSKAKKKQKVSTPTNTSQPSLSHFVQMSQKLPSESSRAKEITEKIARMMIKDFQPYSVVDDAGFKDLLHTLEPRYEIPSRTTFSRHVIPALYEKMRKAIQESITKDFHDGVSSVCFTTDTWTSRTTDSYISLTCHYVRNDFTVSHYVLENSPFPQAHTSVNILEKLEALEKKWNFPLQEIKVSIVADNAANIQGALSRSHWTPVSCVAHTLQLAITDGKKSTPGVLALTSKARSIVGFFHRSTNASHRLNNIQKTLGIPTHQLIQDVETRWNSEFFMLQRLCQQQVAVSNCLLEISTSSSTSPPDNLLTSEWKLASGLVVALSPLEEATTTLSGEKYPTISLVIPLLHGICSSLRKFISTSVAGSGIVFARNLLAAMNARFPNQWKDEDIYAFATVLDPRFKTVLYTPDEKEATLSRLLELEVEHIKKRTVTSPTPAVVPVLEIEESNSLWEDFDKLSSTSLAPSQGEPQDPIEHDLKVYLAEPTISRKENPLTWWKNNESRFPYLANVAKKYLGIPATQVSSERLFSSSGNIVTYRRSSLLPEHIEQLSFLHGNL